MPDAARDYMNLIFTHFRSRMDPLPLLTDAELRDLTMPVLLLTGARDAVFDSEKTVARFEQLVDEAQVRLLPTAGHALVNLAPIVLRFLVETAGDPGLVGPSGETMSTLAVGVTRV